MARKKKKRLPIETIIIRKNRDMVGIVSDEELGKRIACSKGTMNNRAHKPGDYKWSELKAIIKIVNMPDEDILMLARG